jgi:hypothetical protein
VAGLLVGGGAAARVVARAAGLDRVVRATARVVVLVHRGAGERAEVRVRAVVHVEPPPRGLNLRTKPKAQTRQERSLLEHPQEELPIA